MGETFSFFGDEHAATLSLSLGAFTHSFIDFIRKLLLYSFIHSSEKNNFCFFLQKRWKSRWNIHRFERQRLEKENGQEDNPPNVANGRHERAPDWTDG